MRRVIYKTTSSFYHEDAKHLLLIIGQIRTFRETIPYLLRNVVMMNQPMHIVLSLDCVEHEIESLRKDSDLDILPIRHIFITDGKRYSKHPCHIEFRLSFDVLDLINHEPYDFMWMTRTDVMLTIPMRGADIYTPSEYTWNRFRQRNDMKETVDCIYDYIMTAGHPEYIDDMNKKEEHIYWCPVTSHEWNGGWMYRLIRDKTEDGFLPHEIIASICVGERICYLIGSTWFRFGHKDEMIRVIRSCRENNLTFEMIGRFGFENRSHATEAQLRLAYMTHGIHMVDIIRQNDYAISFHEPETDPFHYVFLLRSDFNQYSQYPSLVSGGQALITKRYSYP